MSYVSCAIPTVTLPLIQVVHKESRVKVDSKTRLLFTILYSFYFVVQENRLPIKPILLIIPSEFLGILANPSSLLELDFYHPKQAK